MVDIATLETIGEGALDVGLFLAGMAFPEALPIFAIIKEVVPGLMSAAPYVVKAAEDGKSAFQAAASASPGLGPKLEAIAKQIPMAEGVVDWATHLDNITNDSIRAMYARNLQDSGYNPANDFDEHGNMKVGGA
jgi:hypothetical protein